MLLLFQYQAEVQHSSNLNTIIKYLSSSINRSLKKGPGWEPHTIPWIKKSTNFDDNDAQSLDEQILFNNGRGFFALEIKIKLEYFRN